MIRKNHKIVVMRKKIRSHKAVSFFGQGHQPPIKYVLQKRPCGRNLKRQVAGLTDRLESSSRTPRHQLTTKWLSWKSQALAARVHERRAGTGRKSVTGGIERKPDAVAVQAIRETRPFRDCGSRERLQFIGLARNYGFAGR